MLFVCDQACELLTQEWIENGKRTIEVDLYIFITKCGTVHWATISWQGREKVDYTLYLCSVDNCGLHMLLGGDRSRSPDHSAIITEHSDNMGQQTSIGQQRYNVRSIPDDFVDNDIARFAVTDCIFQKLKVFVKRNVTIFMFYIILILLCQFSFNYLFSHLLNIPIIWIINNVNCNFQYYATFYFYIILISWRELVISGTNERTNDK